MLRRLYCEFRLERTTTVFLMILYLFIVMPVYAELPIIPIVAGSWKETYNEKTTTSSAIYRGTIIGNEKKQVDPNSLVVYLPSTQNSMLCVKISSIDARYYARAKYRITGYNAGIYRIEMPTTNHDVLSKYTADKICVLAELKISCERPERISFIPISWGRPTNEKKITIQLNARGYKSNLVIPNSRGGNDSRTMECNLIESHLSKISFDTLCTFEIEDLNSLCEIYLMLHKYGSWRKPEQLEIFCAK
jgi:hypothetical protein